MIRKDFEIVTKEVDEQVVGGFITTGHKDRHGGIVTYALDGRQYVAVGFGDDLKGSEAVVTLIE